VRRITIDHSLKVKKPSHRTTFRQHSFSLRVIKDWNGLVRELVAKEISRAVKEIDLLQVADKDTVRYSELHQSRYSMRR